MKVKGSSEGESDVRRAEKGMVVATRCPRLESGFTRASAVRFKETGSGKTVLTSPK